MSDGRGIETGFVAPIVSPMRRSRRSGTKRSAAVDVSALVTADPLLTATDRLEFYFHLDRPSVVHGAAIEPVIGGLSLEGWVFSHSGVAGIDVRLDDHSVGAAHYGLARQDVGVAYPDCSQAARSGFAFQLPAAALHDGLHLVKLTVRAQNGEEFIEHFRIDVQNSRNADDMLAILQPTDNRSSRFQQILPTILPTLVDQVYRVVLCRPSDPGGLNHYVELLSAGTIDLRRLVDVLYESDEFLKIVEPAGKLVQSAYRQLFDREPTAAENYNHVQSFRSSCGSEDAAIALLRGGGEARARLGIRPIKIEMDITNQCNIRCVMCPFSDPAIGSRKRRDLDMDTFLRWADEMFSWAAQLGLMFGTEPTLNPRLLEFVRVAKSYGVPNVYFSTNGMKLTPTLVAGLIEAGLDEVNVSLDAGRRETFQRIRRGAKWDVVVGHLRSLRDQKAASKSSRPRLHMSFVMMRSNIQELPEFVELAAELGAEVIYCTHLVSYDGLGTGSESLGTCLDGYSACVDEAEMLARRHGMQIVLPRTRQARVDLSLSAKPVAGHDTDHLAHIDQAREAHGLAKRFARDEADSCCPFPWHFLAIEPDGAVSPCGWWHAGPPMGNLHTQSFQEIWSGETMRNLRSQLIRRELGVNCSRCPAAGVGSSDSAASFQSR